MGVVAHKRLSYHIFGVFAGFAEEVTEDDGGFARGLFAAVELGEEPLFGGSAVFADVEDGLGSRNVGVGNAVVGVKAV